MAERKKYLEDNTICIWKVIDPTNTISVNDKRSRVLFEGKFEECESFMKKNNLKDMKLEPFDIKVKWEN
jgi:hypothetical protein